MVDNTKTPALEHHTLAVRQTGPLVYLFIDGGGVELRTVQAHKAGYDLVRKSNTPDGVSVKLTVNNADIVMPPAEAKRLGAALLRKADAADTFQTENQTRLMQ